MESAPHGRTPARRSGAGELKPRQRERRARQTETILDKTIMTWRVGMFGGAIGRLRSAWPNGRRLALVAAALVSLGAGSVLAGARLDQQNLYRADIGGFGSGIEMAATEGQTFTAGATGSLDRVAVYLERDLAEPLPTGKIILEVFPTDGAGLPRTNAAALGSGSVPTSAAQSTGYVTIPLSRPASVKQGKIYAIVLRADVDIQYVVAWYGSTAPDNYAGGGNAQRADANAPWKVYPAQDYYFKTFVTERKRRQK
jgi:hypothetical protein